MVETVDTSGQDYYDVEYYDEWLGVEDFRSVPGDDEDEALEQFWEVVDGDRERYDIQNVERTFMVASIIHDDDEDLSAVI